MSWERFFKHLIIYAYMVASIEFGAHIKVNVNSETPTVPTVPGHSQLSPTVPDCPRCVPRLCVTFISKNNRCRSLTGIKARDNSGELPPSGNHRESEGSREGEIGEKVPKRGKVLP